MKLHKHLKLAIILLIAMLPYMAYANDSIRIAKRDSILSEITGAPMPQKSLKILSFGAKGDGKKDCKPAFDKAMKRASQMGGARIIVPSGEYLLNGPKQLGSNV